MKKLAKTLIALLGAAIITAWVLFSAETKTSVYNAIILCAESVIPSLFPTLFVVLILINSGCAALVPKKAAPIFLFITSMVSGYPVGAKLLSSMVKQEQLSKESAVKILPSMICAGPAFIINIIGSGIFSDMRLGIRLYLCQLFANFLIFIVCGGAKIEINRFISNEKAINVFTNSVRQSVDSIINICAYVVLFSALSSIVTKISGSTFSKYFLYLFEVTGGVYNSNNIFITCAVISWSGICVIFQVLSAADNLHISIFRLVTVRIISAVLSCAVLKISFILFRHSNPVISNISSEPPSAILSDNILFAAVFFFSLFVLLFSLSTRSTGKFLREITG